LIGRVKSGEIDKERTQPKDEAVVEAARSAPTKCSTCGATLPADIVRGQREITCEYCGSVIRL
jgi:ribosomal protein S27E